MNNPVRTRDIAPLYRSVEELARRRWTTAELLALQESGGVVPDLEYELIDGEIVAMPAEGPAHLDLRDDLADDLAQRGAGHLRVVAEPQLNLTDKSHAKPDIVVRPNAIRMSALRGPDALLVIEISDTRLTYDTTTKADLYASHGVREYWVVNARTLATTIFLGPGPSGYASRTERAAADLLVPHLAPALAVRLSELAAARAN